MATKSSKNVTLSLDSAAGALTAIHAYTNAMALNGIQDVLEDSGMGLEERTKMTGMASGSLVLNGFINSTTSNIFGPLVGNYTSLTKTFVYYDGIKYYTGEAYVENPTISVNAGELATWSCTLQVTGAITRTSVSPT